MQNSAQKKSFDSELFSLTNWNWKSCDFCWVVLRNGQNSGLINVSAWESSADFDSGLAMALALVFRRSNGVILRFLKVAE